MESARAFAMSDGLVPAPAPWAQWADSLSSRPGACRGGRSMDQLHRAEATETRLKAQFVAALAGDAAAYRDFLAALGAHLRAYYRRRMARFPDSVEDLVQETLLGVHANRHTWQAAQPLTAWVHTIARYKLVDFLRSHARHDALNDPLDDDLQIFASSDTEAREALRDLEQILQALPARQRLAVVMTRLEGASVAEAARATGQSEASVKVGVHRGLKLLAAKMRGLT
jgi:RNA polymerase sigma-70 factor (ECF subfamily)